MRDCIKDKLNRVKRIFSNTAYMLRIAFRANKSTLFVNCVAELISYVQTPIFLLLTTFLINILTGESTGSIGKIIFLYALLKISITLFFQVVNNIYSPWSGVVTSRYINNVMINKVTALDMKCFDDSDFFDKYTRALDCAEGSVKAARGFVSKLFALIISLSISFSVISLFDPVVFIFSFANLITDFIFDLINGKTNFNQSVHSTSAERTRNYAKRVMYQPNYIMDIKKSKKLHQTFLDMYNNSTEKVKNLAVAYGKKRAALYSAMGGVNIVLNVALLIYLSINVQSGKMSIGTFYILNNLSGYLPGQIQSFFRLFTDLYSQSLYTDNVREILDYKSEVENETGECIKSPSPCSIQFKDVDFFYANSEAAVLKGISFKIEIGQKIAIVGHNGAGKSTLAKLICGFYKCNKGEILINDKNIREYNTESYRENISTVFQNSNIYALSVAQNVLKQYHVSDSDNEKVAKALEFSGLKERFESLSLGYQTVLSPEFDNGINLSGGEQQKIAIASAYAEDAGVMIFDEPSSNLDPYAEKDFFDRVFKLSRKKTTIFITHHLSNVIRADKILVMSQGKIVEQGTHDNLMALDGIYADMFKKQASGFVHDT